MKLSELTYQHLEDFGIAGSFYMHTDCTDALRFIHSQERLEKAKSCLIAAYGDVEISVHPDADWFDQIKIEDEKWQADHDDYCNKKAEWCNKYGCN